MSSNNALDHGAHNCELMGGSHYLCCEKTQTCLGPPPDKKPSHKKTTKTCHVVLSCHCKPVSSYKGYHGGECFRPSKYYAVVL